LVKKPGYLEHYASNAGPQADLYANRRWMLFFAFIIYNCSKFFYQTLPMVKTFVTVNFTTPTGNNRTPAI